MDVITVANRKGGCGKTATCVNLAAGFARQGKRVVLLDLDAQRNTTKRTGFQPPSEEGGFFSSLDALVAGTDISEIAQPIPGPYEDKLYLVPSVSGLDSAAEMIREEYYKLAEAKRKSLSPEQFERQHIDRLRRSVESLEGKGIDLVLIDTPPALGFHLTCALFAADWLLIPVFADTDSLDALAEIVQYAEELIEHRGLSLALLGVLLGNAKERTRLNKQTISFLRDTFGTDGSLLKTTISSTVKVTEAGNKGQSIFEYEPKNPTCKQFDALAKELLARIAVIGPTLEQELLEANSG